MRTRLPAAFLLLLVATALVVPPEPASGARSHRLWRRVNHLIVIYEENWSYDTLLGLDQRGNGIRNAGTQVRQVQRDGTPYKTLPSDDPAVIPPGLPPFPYDMKQFVPLELPAPGPAHLYWAEQFQIDGGKMDRFVAWGAVGGAASAMGYYNALNLPLGQLAQQYVSCDNWFHSMFGASGPNHEFLVTSQPLQWRNPPAGFVGTFNPDGSPTDPDAMLTSFTAYSITPPVPGDPASVGHVVADLCPTDPITCDSPGERVPPQTLQNIGDRLTGVGVSWAWYAGGWNAANGLPTDPRCPGELEPWHLPFLFFANYAPGTPGREHIKDECDFLDALEDNTLPQVSFVKPGAGYDMHPGDSPLGPSMAHLKELVDAVQRSRAWRDCAIVITFDENGGHWDHVTPPVIDRWGPGSRTPAVIVSPLVRRGFVDHTQYESVSILKFIEERWNIAPLTKRDAMATSFKNAFR